MARGRLTEEEIKILRQNVYVSDVEESRIIYTNEFKFLFIKEYQSGKKPTQIFREAGFDPKILGSKRIERAAHRWKESYVAGSLGSYQDGTIRKRRKWEVRNLQNDFQYEKYLEILEQLQQRIEELERENMRLKKLTAEKGVYGGEPLT